MGCPKLTYRPEPELRTVYLKKELTLKNTAQKARRSYVYGFNGMEKDDEVYGAGNAYTTEFRQLDTRLGRWFSGDPLAHQAPGWTPYRFGFDNPVFKTDLNGLFEDDYFNKEGEYLGSDGAETDDVRIIDEENYNFTDEKFKASSEYGTQVLQAHSQKINENISDEAATGILNHYYEESGYSLSELSDGNITLDKENGLASTKYGEQWSLPEGKFKIDVNKGKFGRALNNKHDFINLYIHERGGHGSDFLSAGRYNFEKDYWQWEKNAVNLQVTHSSWPKTSKGFKEHIYGTYGNYNWILSPEKQRKYFGNDVEINPMTRDEYMRINYGK